MKSILTVHLALILAISFTHQVQAQNTDADNAMEGVFGEEVEVPSSYRFDKRVKMELMTEAGGETSNLIYNIRYQEDNSCVAMTPVEMEGESIPNLGTTVVDFNLMQMITFVDAENSKMATIFPIQEDEITRGKALAQESPDFKATGNVKEILGYSCKEFKLTSSNLKGTVWLAHDIDINLAKSFGALGLQFELGDQGPEEEPKGFIMEFETTNKASRSVTKMKVVELDFDDSFELNTDGYIFTTMPMVEKEMQQTPE